MLCLFSRIERINVFSLTKGSEVEYKFNWSNNSKRKTMKNRICKVIARGKLNSILIEFLDNKQREIVSRNSLIRSKV